MLLPYYLDVLLPFKHLCPVGRLVGESANLSLPKSREMLHFHARIGALVIN